MADLQISMAPEVAEDLINQMAKRISSLKAQCAQYEARIKELTDQCNEIYGKMKEADEDTQKVLQMAQLAKENFISNFRSHWGEDKPLPSLDPKYCWAKNDDGDFIYGFFYGGQPREVSVNEEKLCDMAREYVNDFDELDMTTHFSVEQIQNALDEDEDYVVFGFALNKPFKQGEKHFSIA